MSDDFLQNEPPTATAPTNNDPGDHTMSSVYRLFEAFIGLRERNERQHKLFEQTITRTRDGLQDRFNAFAGETQRAYQQMRQELTGEKRISLAVLNEMIDIAIDLTHIVRSKPPVNLDDKTGQAVNRWMESVEVQCRKVQDALQRHGIHRYDAVISSAYNPALHERVGGKRMEGLDALMVAEQVEPGYASQHPELVLRRPKVIVSE